ncbi:hypothetical protein QYE76_003235 [Lolium multiflorum]|uniref:Uncharacterized protein n=1 Tax=Lolium multiflorum TaxID=4521 RepID=A0AAD8VYN0_LOLMU|nr:hypothetical protein QYE76_003235 [Lolium multiflorum]
MRSLARVVGLWGFLNLHVLMGCLRLARADDTLCPLSLVASMVGASKTRAHRRQLMAPPCGCCLHSTQEASPSCRLSAQPQEDANFLPAVAAELLQLVAEADTVAFLSAASTETGTMAEADDEDMDRHTCSLEELLGGCTRGGNGNSPSSSRECRRQVRAPIEEMLGRLEDDKQTLLVVDDKQPKQLPPLTAGELKDPFNPDFHRAAEGSFGVQLLRPFYCTGLSNCKFHDMDSDDEMLVRVLEDEQAFDDDIQEHLLIIASLQDMLDAEAEKWKRPHRGGSRPGRKKSKPRQRMEVHTMLHNDYFADDATHADNFWRRYRMSKGLFMNILHGVREFDPYFKLKHDVVGIAGFSSIQKCTAAMRMLAYGAPADTQDDYLCISESTDIECMYKFCRAVEACRKDVEQIFGVLQAQFAIVRYPALSWSHDQMWEVVQDCVIVHNMIIGDNRKNHVRTHVGPYECQGPLAEVYHELPADFVDFLAMHAEIRNRNVHEKLQNDLVEHM